MSFVALMIYLKKVSANFVHALIIVTHCALDGLKIKFLFPIEKVKLAHARHLEFSQKNLNTLFRVLQLSCIHSTTRTVQFPLFYN
jgi:hypothetical protein